MHSWPPRALASSRRWWPSSTRMSWSAARGRPIAVVGFTITHGRIAAIDLITDPEKLARVAPR